MNALDAVRILIDREIEKSPAVQDSARLQTLRRIEHEILDESEEAPAVDDSPQGHEMVCSFDDDSIVPNQRDGGE